MRDTFRPSLVHMYSSCSLISAYYIVTCLLYRHIIHFFTFTQRVFIGGSWTTIKLSPIKYCLRLVADTTELITSSKSLSPIVDAYLLIMAYDCTFEGKLALEWVVPVGDQLYVAFSNSCSTEALLLHIRIPRLVDTLYSFWAKYQDHSSALSPAPSMNISNGNSSLPVVIVLTGVSQRNDKGSPFCFSADRTCSDLFPVFFDGKPLLVVMLSVVESV